MIPSMACSDVRFSSVPTHIHRTALFTAASTEMKRLTSHLGISLVKWCVCVHVSIVVHYLGDRRKNSLLSSFSQLEFCCDQDATSSILDAQENCQHITQQMLLDQESQHSIHLSTAPSVANYYFSFALINLHST